MGVRKLAFDAFDTGKIDEYAARARASWGTTPAYKEYEEKTKGVAPEEFRDINQGLMEIFAGFGQIRDNGPASEKAQKQVEKLRDYISEYYYTCTDEILEGLGKMYADGGEFTANIDQYGGEGTAVFVHQAIGYYCR